MRIKSFFLTLIFSFSLLFEAFAADTTSFVYNDFSDISTWQLNGNSTGATNSDNREVLRLTISRLSQSSSAFIKDPIKLVSDNGFLASFSAFFSFQMSNNGGLDEGEGDGADGIVFVIQTVANDVGTVGGGIGYRGGDPHPVAFDALIDLFGCLSDEAVLPEKAVVQFQVQLLREVGLMPQLDRCVSCGGPVSGRVGVFISAREGGVLCGDCEAPRVEKFRTSLAGLRAATSPLEAANAAADQAFDMLDYYITEATGRRPRLAEVFRRASTSARSR